ncbi:hypothetical protein DY218_26425, partial [Streptomyces triticagri]
MIDTGSATDDAATRGGHSADGSADGPTGSPPIESADWEDLVTTALLGTARRPGPAVPGKDPAAALLDAAAVRTVRRRAGI